MLVYHMHNFFPPLSAENLCKTSSFFVLRNLNYFINLSATLYIDRITSTLKKLWIFMKCSDSTQKEFLSKHLRNHIISEFFIQKSEHDAGNFITSWK